MSAEPVVDRVALVKLQGIGGDKLVRQIVRLYRENARERLRQIEEGLGPGGEVSGAGAGAHSLKSSAGNVGAMRVSALAADLEEAVARGSHELLPDLHASLREAAEEADRRLEELMEGWGE
ncbi:MAG: Hpt domain-containing protein [Gemmatimonadales bacterium]|jgi:HPt (histidine-containing phosphotransfer) domain-containing protein|nr:MAG: Hpt domain-containing protein [Gemmatimonadales bacterium]